MAASMPDVPLGEFRNSFHTNTPHSAQSRLLRTEKLVFRIIASSSASKRLLLMKAQQRKILLEAVKLPDDRYENQLLKYFDFTGWIKDMIEGRPR